MTQWLEHAVVLILVLTCAIVAGRAVLRSVSGRRRGACGGCAACQSTPPPPPPAPGADHAPRRIAFLPAEHLGRKR